MFSRGIHLDNLGVFT